MSRPAIAPVLIPHGGCGDGCPYCPVRSAPVDAPGPDDVAAAVHNALQRRGGPVELAFYGGDLWKLPRPERTALLDAAELERRQGRVASIRVTLAPLSVLRAPVAELKARGVAAVEVPVHSLDPDVHRRLGSAVLARAGLEAVGRLARAQLRSIAHLTPGLPSSSHHTALHSADRLLRARPDAVRLLPALSVRGTRIAELQARGAWHPMSVPEAVHTVSRVLERFKEAGVPVIRVGLQPRVDLDGKAEVVGGPWSPDLRLLVENELLAAQAQRALTSVFRLGTRAVTFAVHPAEESWLRGPENRTLRHLRRQFRLDRVVVVPLPEEPRGRVRAFLGVVAADDIPPAPRRRAS